MLTLVNRQRLSSVKNNLLLFAFPDELFDVCYLFLLFSIHDVDGESFITQRDAKRHGNGK